VLNVPFSNLQCGRFKEAPEWDSSKHITIDSLYIQSTHNRFGIGAHFTRHSDSNKIINCTINMGSLTVHPTGSNAGITAGIAIADPTKLLWNPGNTNFLEIRNNLIIGSDSGGAYTAIYLYGIYNDGNIVLNNRIVNPFRDAIVACSQQNLLISENNISRPNPTLGRGGVGINLLEHSRGCTISKNKIDNVYKLGFGIGAVNNRFFNPGDTIFIINNVINNRYEKGGGGIYIGNSNLISIMHNTISFTDTSYSNIFWGGKTTGLLIAGNTIEARNNNIFIANNGGGDKVGIEIAYNAVNITFDYNNLYVFSKSQEVEQSYGESGSGLNTKVQTLGDWKRRHLANNNAQNSTSYDPFFLNDSNLTPRNVNLVNTGQNLGIAEDVNGQQRGLIPDVGAIEFDSSLANTLSFPYYPVGIINTENASGLLDSVDVRCSITGTIVGIDLDSNASISYFLIDESSATQEGINILGFDHIANSNLVEGDSVLITGTVKQLSGYPRFSAHSIQIIQQNSIVPTPILVNSIGPSLEGKFVEIRNSILSSRYRYTSQPNTSFKVSKNNIETEVYIHPTTKIVDSISFVNDWLMGDSICSVRGVVVQDVYRTFPTVNRYRLYPSYHTDLNKALCQIITGVENQVSIPEKINVYPNPSTGIFKIENRDDESEVLMVEVYDLAGKLMYQSLLGNNNSIDLAELPQGVYIVSIKNGDSILITQKLILQK
jgi:hypothetical protein